MITVLTILLFVGICIFCYAEIRRRNSAGKHSPLDILPDIPESCKISYDVRLDRKCKRCAASDKVSNLVVKKRYQLSRDEGGVLKIKELAHLYHCVTCGYRGLYLTKDRKIK
jgi:hypothetical protein